MKVKEYTEDGLLIVSESDRCALWEKTTRPCREFCSKDCFFCKFADFRTPEFISSVENVPRNGKWYSICHHESNRRDTL